MRSVLACLVLGSFLVACTSAEPLVRDDSSRGTTVTPTVTKPDSEASQKPVVDPKNPVEPGFWPLSVAFWDEEDGLLAGKAYLCKGCERSKGAVAVTHDGGTTWRLMYTGSTQVSDLRVLTGGTALATLGYRHSRIIVSRDVGHTWKAWPGSEGLSHPSFDDPVHGWAVAGYGHGLMRWVGSGWEPIKDPCTGEIVDISFPEGGAGRGWLACSWGAGAGNELKGIYETDDGGVSWQARTLVRPDRPKLSKGEGLGGYGYLHAISFLADGSGWLVESRGTFYSTEDAGMTWQEHPAFQEPEIAFGSSAWRVDRTLGYALIGRRGMVLHITRDGGDSWSKVVSFRSPG